MQSFSLRIPRSGLFGLIGPNGAGKTTVFNLLTGVYRPDTGTIQLGETHLGAGKPHEITAAGIARTFQNIRLFPELSVLDNVRLRASFAARPDLCRRCSERNVIATVKSRFDSRR